MDVLFEKYLVYALVVWIYMTGWFIVSLIKKRNDVADVAWGLGIFLVSLVSYLHNAPAFDQRFFVTVLVGIWAIRLATHIYLRNRHKTEDRRYKTWREAWGKWFFVRSYAQVYLLQGALMLVVASPVVISNVFRGGVFGVTQWLGLAVWCIGFFFEAVGDLQLSQFLKDPLNKGKIMQRGLWQYTRHPNYFGEVSMWWGIWLMTLSAPYGLLGIIGPLTITVLILKVSGIPLLEKGKDADPAFQAYKQRVSGFFPWFPNHS